jgi:hypothetical protein
MGLIHFADSDEQEAVLGPLFATAVKADVAIFGPDKFTSTEIRKAMVNNIKIAMHSGKDPVMEILAGPTSISGNTTSGEEIKTLEASMSKLGVPKSKKSKSKIMQDNVLEHTASGREMHDSTVSLVPTTQARGETQDTIMLRRAINGYLFDCAKNIALLENNEWLQGAWSWVKSTLKHY